jgi:hypothetical protein
LPVAPHLDDLDPELLDVPLTPIGPEDTASAVSVAAPSRSRGPVSPPAAAPPLHDRSPKRARVADVTIERRDKSLQDRAAELESDRKVGAGSRRFCMLLHHPLCVLAGAF